MRGESTHGNRLWQPFAMQMISQRDEWKLDFLALLSFACYKALLGRSDFRNQCEAIQQATHGPVGGFR
jgi:hypothetical protein